MNEKLNNFGMNVINFLSDYRSHPGAVEVAEKMMDDDTSYGTLDIIFLIRMSIGGSSLYKLYDDCCGCNFDKFKRTLSLLKFFPREAIQDNLWREHPIPFVDDSIEIDGIPPYGEDFGPRHSKWYEWCDAQIKSYIRRSAEHSAEL